MAKQVETLKLAFIDGEGSASLLHLPGLLATPDVTIASIATLPGTRNPIAQRLPDARDYADDFTGMIEKERPDLVYAIISPLRRYEIAAAVLKASCNLIVNKPPAITTEQIRQLDQIARKQGVTTGVVFYRRYSPLVRRAKALCEERGSVHSATATFYKNSIGREAYSQGGIDALTSDAIHSVDTIRYLCGGEVESVASSVRRLHADWTNAHEALVRFSTGAIGTILTNFACGRRMFTIEAHGKGISCFGDLEEGGHVYADGGIDPIEALNVMDGHDPDYYRGFGIADLIVPKSSWHTEANAHFFECIREGRQPETSFGDATKTMELVDAINQCQI